ncbi:hypothetical protein C0Q70_17173 [Pomacea canaliculata]|uniref:Uncharacterized protein n=1 Tax=Pomacea canaliculata TaxID=400727 RepID=A0A2T7NRW4_POMCA|nr:uncharacterized protein LOC112573869 [Pomacea canaliculata]PVD23898.1 hypothetical protein C0Q70_17173 [Pomacea canaliculata]
MECHLVNILAKRAEHRASVQCQNSTSGTKENKTRCRHECTVPVSDLPSASVSDTMSCDPAVDSLIHHLDHVGQALELTFKEVDNIDAYINRLRCDFQCHSVSCHRYMSGLCTAKIAREACCRTQLHRWQELYSGMLKLYSSIHQSVLAMQSGDSCNTPGVVVSNTDRETSAFLGQLSRMSTLHTIIHRLDPGKDVKAFVDKWILKRSEDCSGCW